MIGIRISRLYSATASMSEKGSRRSFRRRSSYDRFPQPNVQGSGQAAEMCETSAFREWLLSERRFKLDPLRRRKAALSPN